MVIEALLLLFGIFDICLFYYVLYIDIYIFLILFIKLVDIDRRTILNGYVS